MDRKKHEEASSGGPIAAKLIARMKQRPRSKAGNAGKVITGRAAPQGLEERVATMEDLSGYHPAHAPYLYAQNQVSVMSELLTQLKEMRPFDDMFAEAEDLYMPDGPPMSPLTKSYFTCWAFFDAGVGAANETIGTTILEVGAAFGVDSGLFRTIRLMQESRMGVYVHQGTEKNLAVLEELVTGDVRRAIVPAGYNGKKGELWYARVLPPPIPGGAEHVVITTPYILLRPGVREWRAYFDRWLPGIPRLEDYERHMKYGPTADYWNEFVFEAYVNYRMEAIYLAGLPDVSESRPHSQVNEWGYGGGFKNRR